MADYNNQSNLITQGFGFPQNVITSGMYTSDLRYPLPVVSNAFILQGFGSPSIQDLILHGASATIGDLFLPDIMAFDSYLYHTEEFDSPLINKDLITRRHKMWI